MALGFQINDGAGTKVIDDSSLVPYVIGKADLLAASGSMSLPQFANAQNVVPYIQSDSIQAFLHKLGFPPYSDVGPSLNYDQVTNVFTWANITVPNVVFFTATGGIDNPFGLSTLNATISNDYSDYAFIGKAVFSGTESYPYASGGAQAHGVPVFNITVPASVTDILPMVYSPTGAMVAEVARTSPTNFRIKMAAASGLANTIFATPVYFQPVTTTPGTEQIYCFCKGSEIPVSSPMNVGMKVMNAAGEEVFNSERGRNLLRNIETVTLPIGQAYAGAVFTTATVSHSAKAKPIYAGGVLSGTFHAANGSGWYTAFGLIKNVGTMQAKFFIDETAYPIYLNTAYMNAWSKGSNVSLMVADGADYD